ncbi:MAG: winged helix-turn-helix domain-containing protein [Terriglobales bacterium]
MAQLAEAPRAEVGVIGRGKVDQGEDGLYRFSEYRLCVEQRKLWRGGSVVPLTPRALDLLIVLVKNPGRALSRAELLQRVWGGVSVQDSNLTVNLCLLRRALGVHQHYIATLPGRGYQFVEPVVADCPPPPREESLLPSAWLAVCPFVPIGTNSRYPVLGRALVPLLLAALNQMDGVVLFPVSAGAQQADWRLEGSYQELDGQVRVTAQLVGVAGAIAWAGNRDFAAVSPFALQDQIAAWLRTSIRLPRALRAASA